MAEMEEKKLENQAEETAAEEKKPEQGENRKKTNKLVPDDKEILKLLNEIKRGKLELTEPIMDGSNEYTELEYDFSMLKGMELARVLDYGSGQGGPFNTRISETQALNYFACAAAKCQKPGGLDATDIRDRMGAVDTLTAIQVASVFFRYSSLMGNNRISNLSSKAAGSPTQGIQN